MPCVYIKQGLNMLHPTLLEDTLSLSKPGSTVGRKQGRQQQGSLCLLPHSLHRPVTNFLSVFTSFLYCLVGSTTQLHLLALAVLTLLTYLVGIGAVVTQRGLPLCSAAVGAKGQGQGKGEQCSSIYLFSPSVGMQVSSNITVHSVITNTSFCLEKPIVQSEFFQASLIAC